MVYALSLILLVFLVLNFDLGGGDYLYPPFLFTFMFFVFCVICAIGASYYDVHLTALTVFTILLGIAVFTFIVPLFAGNQKKAEKRELTYIRISNITCIMLIVLQLISIVFFIKYLRDLSAAYTDAGYTHLAATNLPGMIKLYDTMTKFWTTIFNELAVPVPMAYRITNPLCSAAEYMLLYIGVNNFILTKRVNIYHLVVYLLMVVRIVLNGSRSPLLRVATFALVVFYILQYRRGRIRKGSYKLLGKIIVLAFLLIIAMFAMLALMGRSSGSGNIFGEIFVYAGAPIANLNIFINRYWKYFLTGCPQNIWGGQTFGNLYQYIAKLTSRSITIDTYGKFEFSGGHEIGNVYTMFASVLYDFGIFGVVFIVAIMAFYYGYTYYKVMFPVKSDPFDFRLFIYAYLVNDLIMSPFSNRFYQTVCDAPFIKLFIVSLILKYFMFDRRIRVKNGNLYYRTR